MSAPRRSLADVKVPHASLLLLALAAIAIGLILYLTRRFNFYYDEWAFVVGARSWTLKSYFLPHNEHWSTVPMLIYRVLFSLFGLRTYTPFLVTLLVMHAGVAVLVFLTIRRRAGELLALAAAALLLFLGTGWENIIWAFQVSFVGSVLFGMLAIYLLDSPAPGPPALGAASAALLLSLMSSGVGVFFAFLVALDLVLDARKRRRLPVLVVPGLAYTAWFLAVGARAASVHRSPLSLTALESLVGYVPYGLGAAGAGLFGLPAQFGALALAALAAFLGVSWARRPPAPLALACAAGLIMQYSLTGLVRSQFGDVQAGSPRYVYVASVFLLLILADALRHLPWQGIFRPAFAVVVVAAIGLNGYQLQQAAHARNAIFALEDADLQTLNVFRDSSGMNRDVLVDPGIIGYDVTARGYYEAVDAMGSPVPPQTVDGLTKLPPAAVDGTLTRLFPPQLTPGQPGQYQCRTQSAFDVQAGSGFAVEVSPTTLVDLRVFYLQPPVEPTARAVLLEGRPYLLQAPATTPGITWHVTVDVPDYATPMTCSP